MRNIGIGITALTFGALSTGAALAAEHSIPCKALPSAVQAASHDAVGNGTVRNCVKDVSGGKTSYELETMLDGRSKDITFGADGSVLEIEQQVELDSLPAPVASAFKRASESGTLGRIESVTHGNTVVSYEGVVTRNGKKSEIAFRPNGASMKPD